MNHESDTHDVRYAKTAKNLALVFQRESLSSGKYGAYAKQARLEGYTTLSNLFYVCSHSELVHMAMHARVALLLGLRLETQGADYETLSVPDMLKDVVSEESLAMVDYPKFLKEAEEEGCSSAILSMSAAMKADETHRRLLDEALNSDNFWRDENKHFYVCALCGYVHEWNRVNCPVCGAIPELFLSFPGSGHFDSDSLLFTKKKVNEEAEFLLDENLWKHERVYPSLLEPAINFIAEIERVMIEKKWSEREIFSVNLALTEAAVNAVEHGNDMDKTKHVKVECYISDCFFFCSIEDEGEGFVPSNVPDPNVGDNIFRESGRGIKLIRGFMTRMWFNTKGNKIFMEKIRT